MANLRIAAIAATVLCLAAGTAAAQSTAPAGAPATDLDDKAGTLSDKLGGTDGVIRPTGDVDPAMHRAAPQTGTMPVLKPGQLSPGVAK